MLRHPYLRALAAFLGAWMCLAGAGRATAVIAAAEQQSPAVALGAEIVVGTVSTLGIFLLVFGATCAAYGTLRSLQRDEARPETKRSGAELPPSAWADPAEPARAAADPASTAAAPPRSIRLVMRDKGGSIVNFTVRDPAKEAHYRARCEREGYSYVRTEVQ
jgi:hypothetical protein